MAVDCAGKLNGNDITIQDVFEGIGALRGQIDDAGLEAVEANACPGAGACGGQFTANTMAMAARCWAFRRCSFPGCRRLTRTSTRQRERPGAW